MVIYLLTPVIFGSSLCWIRWRYFFFATKANAVSVRCRIIVSHGTVGKASQIVVRFLFVVDRTFPLCFMSTLRRMQHTATLL